MKKENTIQKQDELFEPNIKGKDSDLVSTQFSSLRTGLSFQRTRLGADRTLMAVIRTALSLISFGFTIFQFFHHLKGVIAIANPKEPRIFGFTLVAIGILMLLIGISYHLRLMYQIRKERDKLTKNGLIPTEDSFPISMTLIIAFLLLVLGIISITSMYIQHHH